MKSEFWYKVSLHLIPSLLSYLMRVWFSTCRVTVHGQEFRGVGIAGENPVVGSFWHYSFLYTFYHNRKEKAVAMVSGSKDGEYLSRFIQKFGTKIVRGSRNKGGISALKGLIRTMRDGYCAAIVADGSQGPARIVQAGAILLASRTGFPVLPMGWSASHYIRINSWDATAIPYPFSKIDFFYGEPLEVPPKINAEEIEKYRLILEERLNSLYEEAWQLHGKTKH
jgi:hypothetical protein